ncbi:MAG: elongation factor Ts [Candidatus Paceibacterota bacterium]
MITTEQVKELRDKTGVSIMQCKKALEEVEGDIEKALVVLKKKSGEIAAKKSDRELGAGAIGSYLHSNGSVAGMVILSCETDFVANNEDFKQMAYDIAMQVTAMNPEYISKDEIPENALKTAEEVFKKEVEDKPKDIQEKVLSGKVDAYFKDKILLLQPLIKNPDMTVQGLIEAGTQKFGEKIAITKFVRLSV